MLVLLSDPSLVTAELVLASAAETSPRAWLLDNRHPAAEGERNLRPPAQRLPVSWLCVARKCDVCRFRFGYKARWIMVKVPIVPGDYFNPLERRNLSQASSIRSRRISGA